jgi:hypothetical protein
MSDNRRRMVVEEVSSEPTENFEDRGMLDEVKEKVEELEEVTEDLSEDVAKAEEIQEDIEEAVENAEESVKRSEEEIETAPHSHEEHSHPHETFHPEPHDHLSHHSEHVNTVPVTDEPEMLHVHNSSDDDSEPVFENPTGTNPLVIIIPGLFLLGALLGGIYFYQKGAGLGATATPTPEATEITTPTVAPSASPSATVDLTKYPISVQNGSGIAGEAGRAKTLLESGGFKVSGTGNASSYNFTKTVIKVKSDVPTAFVSQLTTTLGKTYQLDANQTLPSTSTDSVQVIVGSTKK